MHAATLKPHFDAALDWNAYLATNPEKAEPWRTFYDDVSLTPEQTALVGGFTRHVRMLCVSGIWCGDCVQQGPLLQRIVEANPCLDLRWADRDQHEPLARALAINQGLRVPVVVFMAEDFEPVSFFGDRTLARYRALAARKLGAACPLPGAPVEEDEWRATLQDWLDEIERVHLLLRLSGRLRQAHGD